MGGLSSAQRQALQGTLEAGERITWSARRDAVGIVLRQWPSLALACSLLALGALMLSGVASRFLATIGPVASNWVIALVLILAGLVQARTAVLALLRRRQIPPGAWRRAGWGVGLIVLGLLFGLGFLDRYLVAAAEGNARVGTLLVPGLLAAGWGLYLLGILGSLWLGVRRQAYAVTDRRVIVLDGESVVSLPAKEIGAVEIREGRGGSGDLTIQGAQLVLTAVPHVRTAQERIREIRPAGEREAAPAPPAHRARSFLYLVEPMARSGDRLYKVFLAGGALCGARVGGQLSYGGADQIVSSAGVFGVVLLPLAHWMKARRAKAEAEYDAIDPAGAAFLAMGKDNFRISGDTIERVILRAARDRHTGSIPNSGTCEIHMRDGTQRGLVVIGEQDVYDVAGLLAWVVDRVEIAAPDGDAYANVYHGLLAAAQADPNAVDFASLRTAYARSPEYDPYFARPEAAALDHAFKLAVQAGEPRAIVKAGRDVLRHNSMHLWVHIHLGFCYGQLGDKDLARYHGAFANAWINSVRASGDGEGPQSAFQVMCVGEEEALCVSLRCEEVDRRMGNVAGHIFDVLTVRSPDGEVTSELVCDITAIARGVQEGRAVLPAQ